MVPVLGYWKIRGLAQPIRLLLAHTGTEFVDKYYNCGPPPDFDRSEWLNEKFNLGLEFPNLPYYIDGDVKLTQTLAIIRHLARKHNLDGVNEQEKIRIDQLEQQLVDNNGTFVRMNYAFDGGDFGQLKINYLNDLPQTLKLLSNFLGEHQYFSGDNLSYVDFLAYEFIDKQIIFAVDVVKQFNNLIEFHSRFEKLPNIDKYIKSDKFLKWPINGDMAKWGSRLN